MPLRDAGALPLYLKNADIVTACDREGLAARNERYFDTRRKILDQAPLRFGALGFCRLLPKCVGGSERDDSWPYARIPKSTIRESRQGKRHIFPRVVIGRENHRSPKGSPDDRTLRASCMHLRPTKGIEGRIALRHFPINANLGGSNCRRGWPSRHATFICSGAPALIARTIRDCREGQAYRCCSK